MRTLSDVRCSLFSHSAGTISFPKGKKTYLAILKEAIPKGTPTTVIQRINPKSGHNNPVIAPPNKIQIIFNNMLIKNPSIIFLYFHYKHSIYQPIPTLY